MTTPEKILIIRFSSLGDIVLASPLLRVLRQAYPAARIDVLVKKEYADCVQYNPACTTVLTLQGSGRDELGELRQRIRRERYDLILDIHNSLRSRYLRAWSGARRVRVVNKHLFTRFCLVNLKKNFYRNIVPVAERYLDTVRHLGLVNDGLGLDLFVPEDARATARAVISRHRPDRYETVIGIAPSARHFTKRWPPDRFTGLGVRCARELHARIILFGGKEDEELCGDICQMINAGAGGAAAESLAGKVSMLEMTAAMEYCSLIITNDSGAMHLAAAKKRKIVAIFGSTVKEFGFFPYGTDSVVVEQQGLACRPCSHIGLEKCPEGHFRCMKDITVDDVLLQVNRLLRESEKANGGT